MPADLEAKTERYEAMLAEALAAAELSVPESSPLGATADDFRTMARSYLEDGRHFRETNDPANALAAFAYGHAWLDAGARLGVFAVPDTGELFTV